MPSLRGGRKTAVALFVDGQETKLAKLSLKGSNVVLEELRSATLVSKIEERQMVEAGAVGEATAEADFGPAPATLGEAAGGEDNTSVILSLLSPYPSTKYAFGYSLAEPSVYYHTLENTAGLAGKRLKSHIVEEIQSIRETAPPLDAIDSFPNADGGLTAVVREDGLGLYRMLEGVKPFIGNRLPLFTLIDSADLALISLVRANYGLEPEEITVIVYIGVEFSRLIFLKGTEFLHFAPVLGEGHEASNIQNTVYSRLLLEQDSIGIPRVDHILIAGEAKRINFDQFLKEQLPEIDIQFVQLPYVDVSQLPEELQEQIPEYAIPIATAWKILQEKHPAFYPANLIPNEVRESQRAFKLAWHGYIVLAMIPLLTVYFTRSITQKLEEITSGEAELTLKQTQAKANVELRSRIETLTKQLEGYKTALGVYNNIVPGSDRWSKVLAKLVNEFSTISAVWITDLSAKEDGTMTMNGFTLYKARVPRVARIFDSSVLQSVEVTEIRDKTVYKFQINVKLPIAK